MIFVLVFDKSKYDAQETRVLIFLYLRFRGDVCDRSKRGANSLPFIQVLIVVLATYRKYK